MRHLLIPAVSAITLIVLAASACSSDYNSGRDDDRDADVVASVPVDASDGEIDTLDLHATLVNAARTYEFELDGQRCLYTVAVSAEWPREIGNADLAALADTLGRAAFGRHGDMPVADAVTAFLADTAGVLPGPGKVTHDFTAPELASGHWTLTTDISRTALTPAFVTYMVTSSSYMGGAHPNTAVTPLTYDLAAGAPVTMAYLFKPGSEADVMKIISSALAERSGCRPDNFKSAGFFTDTLPAPSGMSVDKSGMIEFQYGQYEIGPYAMGIIMGPVAPADVAGLLSPEGKRMLAAYL